MPEIHLQPNIPVQLALQDPAGVPEDFRVRYQLTDGRTLTLPRKTAIELNELDLRPREAFMVCKDVKERKGGPESSYRVWLPAETEQARAAEEEQAAEAEAATKAVTITLTKPGHRRRKPVKFSDQPRLFNRRGTGTYGPLPAAAPDPATGPIPYNIAFREITAFVTRELKAAGEQWTDQAKQDAICTILISAQKQGLLKVWER
jgi:hypothetical protein